MATTALTSQQINSLMLECANIKKFFGVIGDLKGSRLILDGQNAINPLVAANFPATGMLDHLASLDQVNDALAAIDYLNTQLSTSFVAPSGRTVNPGAALALLVR